jgi:hypothetical protein
MPTACVVWFCQERILSAHNNSINSKYITYKLISADVGIRNENLVSLLKLLIAKSPLFIMFIPIIKSSFCAPISDSHTVGL